MRYSVWNIIGALMIALGQWLQVILITRVLGLYDVGVFTYFLVIIGPLILLTRFSLSILIPTQQRFNYSHQVFFYYRNIMNILFIISAVLITFLLGLTVYEKLCLIIFIIFKYFETKEEFIYTENIAKGNIRFLAFSKVYKSIVTTLLFTLAIIVFKSLMAGMLSLFISQLVMYYFYDRQFTRIAHSKKFVMKRDAFRNIFLLGIGLTMVEVLSSLMTNVPRFLIEHYYSMVELGIFGTLMYLATLTGNIIIAINQGVVADLVQYRKENIKKFNQFLFKIFIVLTALIIVGEFILLNFGTNILALIYSEVFLNYQKEIILLGILLCFEVYSKVLEMVISILNKYKIQVVMQGISFIVIVVLSFIFIISHGILGALVAAVITQVLLFIGQLIVVFYYIKHVEV
jgi:O-antigen/teichoic acid export membrane protein